MASRKHFKRFVPNEVLLEATYIPYGSNDTPIPGLDMIVKNGVESVDTEQVRYNTREGKWVLVIGNKEYLVDRGINLSGLEVGIAYIEFKLSADYLNSTFIRTPQRRDNTGLVTARLNPMTGEWIGKNAETFTTRESQELDYYLIGMIQESIRKNKRTSVLSSNIFDMMVTSKRKVIKKVAKR